MTAINTDAFLPHPIDKVWRALTESELLAAWLMPNDFKPTRGHHFMFLTDAAPKSGFDGRIHCTVLRIEPPRLLAISWRSSGLDSTVTWRLQAEGQGTRLFLTHDGFNEFDPAQTATFKILNGGWSGHLQKRLEHILRGLETP
jgi:uncharacterized protein YndB with AHSA1/START domain